MELPNAVPLILTGVETSTVFVIATAYLSSLTGSNATLGAVITDQAEFGLGGVLGATAVIVVIAFAAAGLVAGLRRLATPKGLRITRQERTQMVSLTGSRTAPQDDLPATS